METSTAIDRFERLVTDGSEHVNVADGLPRLYKHVFHPQHEISSYPVSFNPTAASSASSIGSVGLPPYISAPHGTGARRTPG